MPLFDLPLTELRAYRPDRDEPADFDDFWRGTLDTAAAVPLDVRAHPVDTPLTGVTVEDVRFAGWNGDPVHAWYIAPRHTTPLGCVVTYIGYHGGRGLPHQHLVWPTAGWATLVMDSRGQGGSSTSSPGATGDPHGTDDPQAPGMMTKGILSPETYYYRRLFVDAVRAVDVATTRQGVPPGRIVVCGGSQGGGIAQAVAGLRDDLLAAFIDVPFLTHFRRALDIASTGPYPEIVRLLAARRDLEEPVMRTLSYFDGMHFAARARTAALYSVALRDTTCPPSTVFAGYHHWAGDKEIDVWPWNEHEGGQGHQVERQLARLRQMADGVAERLGLRP
ncbi:cephalosporin-C deacetylase [Stackebrandtia albiflava]|uniref:Cephalosporin-C deacetylase n=1 Tax=Stackebrandtia albiflava TaxID=406432 RepID=A0A562VCY1_9ACTN|nr:acetylxylan esterase [Stackebrandtia albiflava]TWJ15730.1 cephalosporin-C deacetylase [Stackebrandtia albiflava]